MTQVLSYLDNRGIQTALLDASEAGFPLYISLGFFEEDKTLLFERKSNFISNFESEKYLTEAGYRSVAHGFSIRPIKAIDLHKLCEFDSFAFGANRQALHQLLYNKFPHRCFLAEDEEANIFGYAFCQESRIGPWIFLNDKVAEEFLGLSLTFSFASTIQAVVPEKNSSFQDVLLRNGFSSVSANRHMWRGNNIPAEQRQLIFGQCNSSVFG